MDYTVEELREFLKKGRDWERLPVKGLEGVYIVKVPAMGERPAHLALEVGGWLLTSREELYALRREYLNLLMRLLSLIKELDSPNGED